jgi:FkbM family methyltransferase
MTKHISEPLASVPITPSIALSPGHAIKIVDVGAAEYGTDVEMYQRLAAAYSCTIVGFEPLKEECERLNERWRGTQQRTYLPVALGDGKTHTLNVCALRGTSSFLRPNIMDASRFQSFAEWMRVERTDRLRTARLDDIAEVRGADFIKLDVQGYELEVLRHGRRLLRDVTIIHCEVEFVQQYENQPLFSEVERFLRSQGFEFHAFRGYGSRARKPLLLEQNPLAHGKQWLWADAVFVKHSSRWQSMSAERLLRAAAIADALYEYFDLAAAFLAEIDRRTGPPGLAPEYAFKLRAAGHDVALSSMS